ncbi:MAG: hypothetical protein KAW56_02900 [Candidatus Marinimicrobia bacterium]|nr:hypothetical protein [Candidatus Neomarinimicrobiota bacterium]
MVKLGMIKNIRIQKLIEIALKNNYNYVTMCHKLGIGTSTWNRWTRGLAEPTNKNIIEKIDRVISKHQ